MSGSVYKLQCPHCKQAVRVRNSVPLHPLLRATYLQCTNLNCGATFRGQMELTHTLSPSACPDPSVNLPLADSTIRQQAIRREQTQQMDFEDLINPQQPIEGTQL